MGLYEYMPSVDDDAAMFRDAMSPKHAASDRVTMKHNSDRQRERQHIADGCEDAIFKFAFKD